MGRWEVSWIIVCSIGWIIIHPYRVLPVPCHAQWRSLMLGWFGRFLTTHQAPARTHTLETGFSYYVGPMQPNGCVRVLLIFPLNCSLSSLIIPGLTEWSHLRLMGPSSVTPRPPRHSSYLHGQSQAAVRLWPAQRGPSKGSWKLHIFKQHWGELCPVDTPNCRIWA